MSTKELDHRVIGKTSNDALEVSLDRIAPPENLFENVPTNKNLFIRRKLRTAAIIFKQDGLKGIMRILLQKTGINNNLSFNCIASSVVSHLSSKSQTIQICQQLSEGVYYVVGMAVEGDIAEFGTMTGKTAVALAASLGNVTETLRCSDFSHGFSNRKLWLFDSFEGLPEARFKIDMDSPHVVSGVWGMGACKGLSPQQLQSLVSKYLNPNKIKIIKGWFKDTVPLVPDKVRFSLVHIDGDLYESAIDVLDNLFGKRMISKGAIIYFDDWNCNAANPDLGERKAWSEVIEKYQIAFSDIGSYGVCSHRFIVHDYSVS